MATGFALVFPGIEHDCRDHPRNPAATGENKYQEYGAAAPVKHGQWRKNYTYDGSENSHDYKLQMTSDK
jgi:hypothetical protein